MIEIKPDLPQINYGHPESEGIIACYPFFEGGGTKLQDVSGRNNHGTLINMVSVDDWIRTPYGWGLDFDGTNDHITIPMALTKPPLTISAWVLPRNNNIHLVYGGSIVGTNSLYCGASSNEWVIGFYTGIESQIIRSTNLPPINKWTHIIVTLGANEVTKLYYNNILIASSAGFSPNVSTVYTTYIGWTRPWSLGYHNGVFANLSLYNRILSASERIQLYTNPWAIYKQTKIQYSRKSPLINFSDMFLVIND